mgnify:CR=1 FL=1
MGTTVLSLNDVSVRRGDRLILGPLNFSITQGERWVVLGPNGAGKTTLIRMITGIFYPDAGNILLNGKKFDPVNDVINIGYMPEERGLYKKMKIGEQAMYLAQLKGLSKSESLEKIKYWFKKFEMESWWNKKVEDLSSFAAVFILGPDSAYSDLELFLLDQYVMGGGNLVVAAEGASLDLSQLAGEGSLALPQENSLDRLLFRYGVRVNRDLIQDLNFGVIPVMGGNFGEYGQGTTN